MLESRERLAHNEVLFREVNERIKELAGDNEVVEFLCECGNTGCLSRIELTVREYERVRSNPIWFVIKPGHDSPAIERVISQDAGFAVVERLIDKEHLEETDLLSDET